MDDEIENILMMFKQAKKKKEQIKILADLTNSDEETIIEILHQNGLYVKEERCMKCGKKFHAYISRRCPECELKIRKQRAEEEARKKWIQWQIADLTVKRNELLKKVYMIDKEIDQLMKDL